ncbi:hypothetical protein VNI00_002841 [Paramarasmius palmivorus]|uniref:RanBP2-type domain-containing protein n=1 Tax=Paramarasmius palmivorus TaxID=297713 RepID=A0AAW0DWF1_9AGAR
MSAIRRGSRSGARPSPYARPQLKKSSWSISGFLSYLNPLRFRSSPEISTENESGEEDEEWNAEEHGQSPAQALSARGRQMANTLTSKAPEHRTAVQPTRQPPTANGPPPLASQKSTSQNLFNEPVSASEGIDIVTSFLESRRDQPISSIEAEGLISLLRKTTPAENREPFRFSSSTPSTPPRGNSPLYASTSTNFAPFRFSTPTEPSNASQTSDSSTPKLLKHNPNGTYRWQGGGSAKPRSRNRYQSPSFGAPRSSSQRLVLKDSPEKATKTDTKRRRVGDEPQTSSASPSGSNSTPPSQTTRSPAPALSPTRAVQAVSFSASNGGPNSSSGEKKGMSTSLSSSRLRPPLPQKPTTPAVPSPLRQAWGQSSPSTSSDGEGSPQAPPRQTKAANFVSELISQVTPTRHLDVSNPYQVASPVKTTGAPKQRSRRTRATDKNAVPKPDVNGSVGKTDGEKDKVEKGKEKTKEPTAQAIIEATVPKGSTRSRPPANIGNGRPNGNSSMRSPSPAEPRKSPRKTALDVPSEIEEIEDEEQRPTKKAKANGFVNGFSSTKTTSAPAKSGPTIEEVSDDDEMVVTKETIKPSEVVEADKPKFVAPQSPSNSLEVSSGSTKPSLPVFGAPKASTIPREPSKLRQSFLNDPTPSPAPTPTPSSLFSSVPSPDTASTASAATASSSKVDPKQAALAVPLPSLPTFTFAVPSTVSLSDGSGDAMAKAKTTPRTSLPRFEFGTSTSGSESTKPVTQSFDFAAAGMKPIATPSSGTWKCSACELQNDNPIATKCFICDQPRNPPPPKPEVQAFDWAAAGMKPAPLPASGSWTCSVCQLKNDNAAATQCTICDTPR